MRHQVEVVGPTFGSHSHQRMAGQGYDLSAFMLDWQAHQARCPQGQTSVKWTPGRDVSGNPVGHSLRHGHLSRLSSPPGVYLGQRRPPPIHGTAERATRSWDGSCDSTAAGRRLGGTSSCAPTSPRARGSIRSRRPHHQDPCHHHESIQYSSLKVWSCPEPLMWCSRS